MKKGTCHHGKLVALRRIAGQVAGIQKMIDEERYCIEILNAIGATIGALKKVEADILKDHLGACVKTAFEQSTERDKDTKIEEIYNLLRNSRR